MLHLNSPHLDAQAIELCVKLSFHLLRTLADRILHLLAFSVAVTHHVCADLVVGIPYVFSHLFDLFKLAEELVGKFARFEYFIGCVGPNLLHLLL